MAFLIYGLSDEYQNSLNYGSDHYHYSPPAYKSPVSSFQGLKS